jgi:hypothetical protein
MHLGPSIRRKLSPSENRRAYPPREHILQRDLSRLANLALTKLAANSSWSSSAMVEDNFVNFAFSDDLKTGAELDVASSVLPSAETKVSRDIIQTTGLTSLPRNL